MPNAEVNIDIGVSWRKRLWDEPFKPTATGTSSFNYITDLENYLNETEGYAAETFANSQAAKALGAEVTTHVGVRLDNPTHPEPAMGVVPLAKDHLDMAISHDEFTSPDVLRDTLNDIIANLKRNSKY